MKKIILMSIVLWIVLGACFSAHGQEKICVEQTFIDSATKAFEMVVSQREVINKFLEERAKSDAEKQVAGTLIKSLDELLAIKDKTIAAYEKMMLIYENVIKMQFSIIEQLEKRLLKPKSFLDKFLKAVKDIVVFAAGVVIGRGLVIP